MLASFSALCCTTSLVLLVGCGGGPKTKGPVKSPSTNAGDAGTGLSKSDADLSPATLSQENCEELFEHVFPLAFIHHQAEAADDAQANEADLAVAKARLREEILGLCVGADREGFGYDCAMAAKDVPALQTCMQ